MIDIRAAKPDDGAAIEEVHIKAFRGPAEAQLVQLISERKKALISLVALHEGKVVGHILFSAVTIANAPVAFSGVGLVLLPSCRTFRVKALDQNSFATDWNGAGKLDMTRWLSWVIRPTTLASALCEQRTSASKMNTASLMSLWCCRYMRQLWKE